MLIATLPPIAKHSQLIAQDSRVDALRFNSIMPTPWSKRETLERLLQMCERSDGKKKPLYFDIKGRQLRVKNWGDPWYTYVELNHAIEVETPCEIILRGGSRATIVKVDSNKLLLEDAPHEALGTGQAVNILHPSLKIHGYLTEDDREYLETGKDLGLAGYLLSFFEGEHDLDELTPYVNRHVCYAKIESQKGLDFLNSDYHKYKTWLRLMAARDDLYIQLQGWNGSMLDAEELIVRFDPDAVAASRIFTSLEHSPHPSLGDVTDFVHMYGLGYRSFMLSDGLCKDPTAFFAALSAYQELLHYSQEKEKCL